jgi:hypothetical protein
MQKWEYTSVEYGYDRYSGLLSVINMKGNEGWELVSLVYVEGATKFIAVLKRPKA